MKIITETPCRTIAVCIGSKISGRSNAYPFGRASRRHLVLRFDWPSTPPVDAPRVFLGEERDGGRATFVEMEWAVATVLSALERKRAERATAAQPLLVDVRSRLSDAAQAVRERFGARRVFLFGSYARGTPSIRSDVDVAVDGVAAEDHFRAMALLSERLGCSVDLVLLEDLRPEDRQRLLDEAELV